jgi:hypothetical protein
VPHKKFDSFLFYLYIFHVLADARVFLEEKRMSITNVEGMLDCGLAYSIHESRKKSPGLNEGQHFIAVFKDLEVPIHDLPPSAFRQLASVVHDFAVRNAFEPGAYRVAYNGPGVGRRNHAHIHIMFPKGADKLPTLVETSDKVV